MDPLFVTSDNSVKNGILGVTHTKQSANFKSPKFLMFIELMRDSFIDFFTFLMLCKWCETFAVLTSSAWIISLALWRGFCSTTAYNCFLSRLDPRPLPSLSLRILSPLRNCLNHLRTIRSHVNPTSHALLLSIEVLKWLCPTHATLEGEDHVLAYSSLRALYASKLLLFWK